LADFLVKPITRETLLDSVRRANPRARTIAVVDDDLHMVRLLSRMLRSSGERWRVVRAYDGHAGLALIRRVRPEVVLLDLVMPRGGGLALLEAVRDDPTLAQVAVIAVSAQDIAEVLPTSNGRGLTLVADPGLTINQTLRGVQALLDVLPPAGVDPPDTPPELAAEPAGSVASG
jgi:CheY-like chemotaxis protein